MFRIRLPSLAENFESAKVGSWNFKVGDEIKEGDEVLDMETDKGSFAIQSDGSGTLTDILAYPGKEYPVGYTLGIVNGNLIEMESIRGENERLLKPKDDIAAFLERKKNALQK
jgi:pyruvate/2-oxoglutarate dehydrogenase complex dihydrolipoamide acyltransferase (E2) component